MQNICKKLRKLIKKDKYFGNTIAIFKEKFIREPNMDLHKI